MASRVDSPESTSLQASKRRRVESPPTQTRKTGATPTRQVVVVVDSDDDNGDEHTHVSVSSSDCEAPPSIARNAPPATKPMSPVAAVSATRTPTQSSAARPSVSLSLKADAAAAAADVSQGSSLPRSPAEAATPLLGGFHSAAAVAVGGPRPSDVFVPCVLVTAMQRFLGAPVAGAVLARRQRLRVRGVAILRGAAGDAAEDRGSRFEAFLVRGRALSRCDVADACAEIRSDARIAPAAHRTIHAAIMAGESSASDQRQELADDDGEDGAGETILRVLRRLRVPTGTCIVVTRWFGGILLGPARFRHIERVSEKCLRYHGLAY